jgi:hypothetical protein
VKPIESLQKYSGNLFDIKIIYESNLDIIDLSTKDASLEDVFINITSHK